ncbi:MAG: hypothetical protein FJX78_04650 [Armatimonadetes bacterium]|nr:hypothetical protein [Armatimonadota bacterium]
MRIPPRNKFDLCFLFASPAYEEFYSSLLKAFREGVPARHLIGCSAAGVIGVRREVESEPGLALAAVTMPGATLPLLQCSWIEMSHWEEDACRAHTGGAASPNAWFVFADPYTVNAEGILRTLSSAYEGVPLIGGLATAAPGKRHTFLFLDGVAYTGGVVGIGVGGAWTARTVVSQGYQPIGETWTVTAAEGNLIHGISGPPAFDVLQETMDALPESTRRRRLARRAPRSENRRGVVAAARRSGEGAGTSGSTRHRSRPRIGSTSARSVPTS